MLTIIGGLPVEREPPQRELPPRDEPSPTPAHRPTHEHPAKEHPLLFVHGMWEGSWIWQNYLEFFAARGYDCYALNLRGYHPDAPVADVGQVSVGDYIADVQAVAAAVAQGAGHPILIGHSLGGLLVLKVAALQEPVKPPAIVALAPAGPRGIPALRTLALLQATVKHFPQIMGNRPLLPSRKEMNASLLNRLSAAEQARVYERMVPASGRQTRETAVLGLPVEASKVGCPRLIIGAAEDQITTAGLVRQVARKFGATHREYAEMAHMMMLEPPWQKVAKDIAQWLDTEAAGSPTAP